MSVNYINEDFKSQKQFFQLLTPRINNNRKEFIDIINPEKKQQPLSLEILKRTEIVSEIKNSLERIHIKNEAYYAKLNELNANNKKIINRRDTMKKKSINPQIFYQFNLAKNSYYLNDSKNKRHLKGSNYNDPSLKINLTNSGLKINGQKNNLLLKSPKFLRKIKQSLTTIKGYKNIISRNQILNLSSLTDITNILNKHKKRKSITSRNPSEESIRYNKSHTKEELCLDSLNPSNKTNSNKKYSNILKPCKSNITFTSCFPGYKDKYIGNKNILTSPLKTESNLTKEILYNSNIDINRRSSRKINAYNNYNYIYSEEGMSKQNDSKNDNPNFSSSLIKINKLLLHNKSKIDNLNNIKNFSNNFKNYFNKQVDSLNIMTHKCKKNLANIIDITNKEINNTKGIQSKKNKVLLDELDIRKDILIAEDEKNYLENKAKKKLIKNKSYKLNLTKRDKIKSFNILKRNLKRISDLDALNLIENYIDKKQKVKLDVNKLIKDYNNRKKEKELIRFVDIKQKVENNHKILLKMKYL